MKSVLIKTVFLMAWFGLGTGMLFVLSLMDKYYDGGENIPDLLINAYLVFCVIVLALARPLFDKVFPKKKK